MGDEDEGEWCQDEVPKRYVVSWRRCDGWLAGSHCERASVPLVDL